MKLMSSLIFAAALSLTAGTAFAACPDPAQTDAAKTGAIAKDGTHAPLEGANSTENADPVAKDGSNMPLATQEGNNKDLATSQQDVEAQQQGDKTAAAQADDDCKE